MTGSVGSQAATDPDHRSADCAADAPLGPAGCDKSPPSCQLALFAPALLVDLNVVWVDQDLEVLDQHLGNHLLSIGFLWLA